MTQLAPTREPEGPSFVEELAAIPYEPLLPVEKKRIVGSLLLGAGLLGILLRASSTYFPITAVTR
jgi:hypothetical protein